MQIHTAHLRDLPKIWKDSPAPVLLRTSLVAILIALYLASTLYNVGNERRLIENDIERITIATTNSAQIHTQFIFNVTINTLQSLRSDMKGPANSESLQDLLDQHFFGSPYLRTTFFLDETGVNLASNYRELVGSEGVGYQFFEVHRNADQDSSFTGDIIVGRISRSAHFISSIGVRDKTGEFHGVLAAAYELSYFKDLYSQFAPESNYVVALYHEVEGLVVASDSEMVKGRLPSSTNLPLHLPSYESMLQTIYFLGKSEYPVQALSLPLEDTQFHVVTFADTSRLLSNHWQSNQFKFLLAGLFTISVIGLMLAVELHSAGLILSERENLNLESNLRQSQKLEALGTLASGFAHDFNNLLSSIIGFAELAHERLKLSQSTAADAIQQVLLAGRRAESMVERVLEFSQRSDGQTLPFEFEPIIGEALKLARIGMSPKTNVEININQEDSWMFGDPSQMHQLVTNLTMNAVQAMPDGGTLSIALRRKYVDQEEKTSMGLAETGAYLEFLMTDTGVGISPTVQERMYDPFFTTKEHGKGSGLGLSIVFGIIEEHRGAIKVSSIVGAGTEFTILIPSIDKPATEVDLIDAYLPIDGQGKIAVVVDDEESIVMLAEERLASFGFEPHGFTDSMDAIEHIEQNAENISLLITDIAMPILSGIQLAKRARNLRPDLPIILITGISTREVTRNAEAIGVGEIIRKPLRAKKLAEAISRSFLKQSSANVDRS